MCPHFLLHAGRRPASCLPASEGWGRAGPQAAGSGAQGHQHGHSGRGGWAASVHVALRLICSTEHAHVERGGQVHETASRRHAGWGPVERMTVRGSGAVVGGELGMDGGSRSRALPGQADRDAAGEF